MGFLDNSTNNIIIDAVLTDTGRRKLADNNGSFKIAFFSLADDEVDYTIIQKFGRTVGKEKITKNTPIFEAQTQGNLALKNRLLTLPDPTIIRLPTLSLAGSGGLTDNTIRKGPPTPKNGAATNFDLQIRPSLDDTMFSVYGDGTTINTVVAVVGDQSGLRKEFSVTITK